MRVLMVAKDALLGGMTRHCFDLSKALGELAVDVTLLAPRSRKSTRTAELDLSQVHTIRPRSIARLCSTELSPGLVWQTAFGLADVLHVHLPSPLAVLALLVRSRSPFVVTYHCDLDRRFGPLASVYEPAARRVLQRAAAVVVASDHLRGSDALRDLGSRVRTIPFGSAPRLLPTNDAVTAALQARLDSRLVLFVGRLVYYKGVDVLLRAMLRVSGTLVIVGDGAERPRLEALAKQLGLDGRVRFVGLVDEATLSAYYSAAKVLTLPSVSHGEAFGLVQVEAALFGCPTVSSRLPGVSWVNVDGETGLTVAPRAHAELAHAITTLLDDPALANKLGAAARARALQQFPPAAMADRTLALYRELQPDIDTGIAR